MPFGDSSMSDKLGANAFKITFAASNEKYQPPETSRRSLLALPTATTANAQQVATTPATAHPAAAIDSLTAARRLQHDSIHPVPAATATTAAEVTATDAATTSDGGTTARAIPRQGALPRANSLALQLGHDWSWNFGIPAQFGSSALQFVFQKTEASTYQTMLQGEWEGETTAEGRPAGVEEFVGNGACPSTGANAILSDAADSIVNSRDACLELCGAIAGKLCTYFSYAASTQRCILWSSCAATLVTPTPPYGASFYKTWRVPYSSFVTLTCAVRVVIRQEQMHQHVYNCGGGGAPLRRSFKEGFSYGNMVLASAKDRICSPPDIFPCSFTDSFTGYEFYQYLPFAISWTTRSPDQRPGLQKALFTFSISSNAFLYESIGQTAPAWTLQFYFPDSGATAFPLIQHQFIPLITQPSNAQVINLKKFESDLKLQSRVLSKQMAEYPSQFASYENCNSSIASLLNYGTIWHKSPACAALVKLVFPSRVVTQPSGLTATKLVAAKESECYQDFLSEVRTACDLCANLWQKCDTGCVDIAQDGTGCGAGVGGGTGAIARVNSDVVLVRELLKKVIYLADAIYYLTTSAHGSKNGIQCGTPLRMLLESVPELASCQVQDYLSSGGRDTGCYATTVDNSMNPPFFLRSSSNEADGGNHCSKACQEALDEYLYRYGCCAATDRAALDEWWTRVGHPRFTQYIIDWPSESESSLSNLKSELFISPSSSAAMGTCDQSSRAFSDCALTKCKHSPGVTNPSWEGWQDYPLACCNMTCPSTATKSYGSACNCMCTAGATGTNCTEFVTHVLAEIRCQQHTATHCNTLQHTATHCNTLQHTATHCNTLQHTATHCNTL